MENKTPFSTYWRLFGSLLLFVIASLITHSWIAVTANPLIPDVEVELFADDVTFPVTMEFAPDGRLFVAERFVGAQTPITGTIRVISSAGVLQDTPFAVIELADSTPFAEKGLIGLTLDPAFAENGYVYAYRTAAPDAKNANQHGEILRYTSTLSETNWIGTDMVTLVDDLPVSAGCCHNGGILRFGPDDKLYLSIGYGDHNAQDLSTRAGKLLRFNADGNIPADNPFVDTPSADSAIYAYGLRNTFGFDWHPTTAALYATENGQNCDDELNLIVAGGNYGWPLSQQGAKCIDPGADYVAPVWVANPPVGLTGIAFYDGTLISEFQNQLFMGDWNHGTLYQVQLLEDNNAPVVTSLIENCGQPNGDHNLLFIASNSDGYLYFSCQEEGFPASPQTGAIYRVVPGTTPNRLLYLPLINS